MLQTVCIRTYISISCVCIMYVIHAPMYCIAVRCLTLLYLTSYITLQDSTLHIYLHTARIHAQRYIEVSVVVPALPFFRSRFPVIDELCRYRYHSSRPEAQNLRARCETARQWPNSRLLSASMGIVRCWALSGLMADGFGDVNRDICNQASEVCSKPGFRLRGTYVSRT